jgi:uncharacterized Tic20 family protein
MARRDDDDDDDDDRPKKKKKKSGGPSKEERQMGMFCHLGGIIGGFILPLIIWLTKKEESEFIDDQGKEALNFQITILIANLGLGLITCGLAIFVMVPLGIVFSIMGATAANRGEYYRYPMNIRMIK